MNARGKKEQEKHLAGEKLSMRQRILAKCYNCMNEYADGKVDCEIEECSLYAVMPYRQNKNPEAAGV